jgi:hypothetical protein
MMLCLSLRVFDRAGFLRINRYDTPSNVAIIQDTICLRICF